MNNETKTKSNQKPETNHLVRGTCSCCFKKNVKNVLALPLEITINGVMFDLNITATDPNKEDLELPCLCFECFSHLVSN